VPLIELAVGLLLVGVTLYDLFQSVVLPRPAVGRIRISPRITAMAWRAWRAVGTRFSPGSRREGLLAVFAPIAVIMMLAIWVAALVTGYGFVVYALRDQVSPPVRDLPSAFYISGLSLFTLGFSDVVPVGPAERVLALVEAATGLGVVALVISLLFSLFNAFQRRESLVVTLDASAGAPPTGVNLLENCARYHMPDELTRTFNDWRHWTAEVLESHLAYPILVYFRSSHDNEAWVNSFGAVMDAALLTFTTLEHGGSGPARMMFKVGQHLVEDVSWYFSFPHPDGPGIERQEFDAACDELAAAGYELRDRDDAWAQFSELRSQYAGPLNGLAHHLVIVPASAGRVE
jgi:nitrate reductase NapE component